MKPSGWVLPTLAVVGVCVAVFAVMRGERGGVPHGTSYGPEAATPATRQSDAPAVPIPPFESFVTGTGIVEAGSGNIAIGTPVRGIVAQVRVGWGDAVKPGDELFRMDDRELRNQRPPAAARVEQAEAALAKSRYELELAERLRPSNALSEEQLQARRFQVRADAAAVATVRAEVARLDAEVERRIVRSPVAGRVLQINTRPGEFADSAVLATPLMVVGDDSRLRVRVDIDQHEALRIVSGAPAVAFVRGDPGAQVEMRFESIEPYVIPRKSLTGDPTERVDTRVLQVIYSFNRASMPVFVGQQLDVYLQATAAPDVPGR